VQRHDSVLEDVKMGPEVLSCLLHVYIMWSLWRTVTTATVTAAVMQQRFSPVLHEANMFNSCDRPCDCHSDYHIDQRNDVTLGMWKTLKLIQTVIKYPVLWQLNHKGTAGCRTLLSIGCGKGNFAECGKLSRGNLWKIQCGFFAVE